MACVELLLTRLETTSLTPAGGARAVQPLALVSLVIVVRPTWTPCIAYRGALVITQVLVWKSSSELVKKL
jgi:hypothetical protein